MKKLLFAGTIFLASILTHVHAQSINNKNWRAWLDAPINDSVTFHIQSDSSFVTNSNGDVVIRIRCTVTPDTLIIVNQDAEEHGCPNQIGKYKIDVSDDKLVLSVIDDACDGRSRALTNTKWRNIAK